MSHGISRFHDIRADHERKNLGKLSKSLLLKSQAKNLQKTLKLRESFINTKLQCSNKAEKNVFVEQEVDTNEKNAKLMDEISELRKEFEDEKHGQLASAHTNSNKKIESKEHPISLS